MQTNYRNTALEVVMDCAPEMKSLLDSIRAYDRNLHEQIKDAFESVIHNLSEADGNRKGTRRARLDSAQGSNTEVQGGLRLAAAWQYVPRDAVEVVITYLHRAGAMTYRRLQHL